MRKLTYFIACTADGFIARDDGSFDFFPMTGDHLSHIATEYPETIPGHLREHLGVQGDNKHFDTVLMGRNTYQVGTAMGVTNPYPHLQQYVLSRTLTASPDPAVRLVSENPVELVRELKNRPGLDIWLCGGAQVAGALYEQIDELILKINPVMLGTGIPLFKEASGARNLQQIAHQSFSSGVTIQRYRVAT